MKAQSIGVLIFAAGSYLAATACGGDEHFRAMQYDGVYTGTWTNAANGQSGPVTIAIDIDEGAGTASLTIDFGGNYLGLGDPPPASLSGVFDDDGAVVKGSSELFGQYDVTIDPDGTIVGLMEDVGGGVIPKLTYTGKLTKTTMEADYHATRSDGSTSDAVLKLTKPDD